MRRRGNDQGKPWKRSLKKFSGQYLPTSKLQSGFTPIAPAGSPRMDEPQVREAAAELIENVIIESYAHVEPRQVDFV